MIDSRRLLLLGMLGFIIGICVGIRLEHDNLANKCAQVGEFEYHNRIYRCEMTKIDAEGQI